MISIIIPAHNEASVIEESLKTLEAQRTPIETIVVCNGCTDETSDIVKSKFPSVRCIETPVASKTHALNLGDEVASHFPRIYMDADIRLEPGTVDQLCEKLREGLLAVSPTPRMDLDNTPWLVKAYYRIWLSLPYCKTGLIGSGVYVLSEEGRSRFGEFPHLIADDGYVRCHFSEEEMAQVSSAHAIVRAPRTISGLIKIKTRSRLGRYQLAEMYPDLVSRESKRYSSALFTATTAPSQWLTLGTYFLINIYSRLRAGRQYRAKLHTWERDETTRV